MVNWEIIVAFSIMAFSLWYTNRGMRESHERTAERIVTSQELISANHQKTMDHLGTELKGDFKSVVDATLAVIKEDGKQTRATIKEYAKHTLDAIEKSVAD